VCILWRYCFCFSIFKKYFRCIHIPPQIGICGVHIWRTLAKEKFQKDLTQQMLILKISIIFCGPPLYAMRLNILDQDHLDFGMLWIRQLKDWLVWYIILWKIKFEMFYILDSWIHHCKRIHGASFPRFKDSFFHWRNSQIVEFYDMVLDCVFCFSIRILFKLHCRSHSFWRSPILSSFINISH